jgi:hypothetical protein
LAIAERITDERIRKAFEALPEAQQERCKDLHAPAKRSTSGTEPAQ